MLRLLFALLAILAVALAASDPNLDDPVNCLSARWELVFGLLTSNIKLTTDPYVYYRTHPTVWASEMCTSDPDPIRMTDPRCQCDAAVQFYLQDDPQATPQNAFQRYSAQVAAAIADSSLSAPTWHCEACPNTSHPRTLTYRKIPASCTCIAAREAFVNNYPFVGAQDYDPVGFNEIYGALANTQWVNCSLCDNNPVYMEQYQTCEAAQAFYRVDTKAWWAPYFNDTWLAYRNSFLVAGYAAWNYKLCDTGYGFDIVQDPRNCLAQRLNLIYTQSARAIYVRSDPFAWGLNNGVQYDASLCTSDPDPIYMYDTRCQCDAAKRLYIQDNPNATMANAYSLWVQQVNQKNKIAPTWHCEACPNTVKKNPWTLNVVPQQCTCLAARTKFLQTNPEVKAADWDPVFYIEKLAQGSVSWDCSPCNVNPVYIDAPVSRDCAPALQRYSNEVWFAKYFNDTFLAYWTSVMITGRPIYHYELCNGQASTSTSTSGKQTTSTTSGKTTTTTTTGKTTSGKTTTTTTTAKPTTSTTSGKTTTTTTGKTTSGKATTTTTTAKPTTTTTTGKYSTSTTGKATTSGKTTTTTSTSGKTTTTTTGKQTTSTTGFKTTSTSTTGAGSTSTTGSSNPVPTIPCQIARPNASDIARNGFQLMGDPLYKCGFQSIINTSLYFFNPFSTISHDYIPYWQFAEWWTKEYIKPSSGKFNSDGSYSWSNAYKSLTLHTNGSLTMAMDSIAEYDGGWRDQSSSTWDAFLLSQPISSPGGAFYDPANNIATMTKLYFSIRVKLLYSTINPQPGYMPVMHASQTPLYYVIQNLNPSSAGYGQLVWLGVPLYDNRYAYPFGDYFVDPGTGSLIYGIGYGNFTATSTHSGEWVTLQADLLPHAKRGIQIAYEQGLFASSNFADYQVGGMNIGFEMPGSFLSAMTWEKISLRYFSQAYPEPPN